MNEKASIPLLRLLVDVNIGIKVEKWLKEKKIGFISIRNINPRMEDQEILKIALEDSRIVITIAELGNLFENWDIDLYKSFFLNS